MATKAVTDATFEAEILKSNSTVLVDFWAEWCGPCRALGPKLEEISNELGETATIVKVNVDENPESAAKYGIRSIPSMLIFKSGEKVETLMGNMDKDSIVENLKKHI